MIYFLFALLGQALDVISTEMCLPLGGYEANPIVRPIVHNWILLLGIKWAIATFVYLLARNDMKSNKIYLILCGLGGFLPAIHNFILFWNLLK